MNCQVEKCEREALDGNINEGNCILHSPDADKDLNLFRAEIEKIIEDVGKVGDGVCNFGDAVFPKEFDCRELQPAGAFTCRFTSCRFLGYADFEGFIFEKEADFRSAKFDGVASFSEAEFGGPADFRSAKFGGSAYYTLAEFGSAASFSSAKFGGGAFFSSAKFGSGAFFRSAKFGGSASFGFAKFGGSADFSSAEFGGGASFSSAEFGGDASFHLAEFGGDASFRIAKFDGETHFTDTKFEAHLRFDGVVVLKSLIFTSCTCNEKVGFRNVLQTSASRLSIHRTNLCNWTFLDTDLRDIDFDDISFVPRDKLNADKRQVKRLALHDETQIVVRELTWRNLTLRSLRFIRILFRRKKKFYEILNTDFIKRRNEFSARVERLYRHLKFNLETNKDYAFAGQFYFGEMEMKRLQKRWYRQLPFLIYKGMSGYGERYIRALLVLIVMIIFFSGLLMFAGYDPEVGEDKIHRVLSFNFNELGPTLVDWGKSFIYTAQAMTIFKQPSIKFIDFWGELVRFFAAVLGALQLGLFALALRRQFKR